MIAMRAASGFVTALMAAMLVGGCTIDHSVCGGPAIRDSRVQELAELYELAAAPRSHAVRSPTRVQRERAIHLLAEKAAETAAEWDSEVRPVALTGLDRAEANRRIESFREALRGLEAAARKADAHALHDRFAETLSAYRSLSEPKSPMN